MFLLQQNMPHGHDFNSKEIMAIWHLSSAVSIVRLKQAEADSKVSFGLNDLFDICKLIIINKAFRIQQCAGRLNRLS